MLIIRAADEEVRAKAKINDELCLAAVYKERLLGWISYDLNGQEVMLIELSADDDAISDGLVRAALNDARRKGAVTAFTNHKNINNLIDGSNVNIVDFFNRSTCS